MEKKRRREREISGHFSTPLCKSRNAADYARFWRERARKPGGGGGKKKGEKEKKEESGKGNKKGGLPGLWPLAGPRTRSTGSVREGGEVERAKKSRECCKNPGPPIGRIVSSR